MELTYESLRGLDKAAILVISLGVEASSTIFKNMN